MKRVFIVLSGVILLLYSCKPETHTALYRAEELMQNHPDSALKILVDLQEDYNDMPKHEQALFGLLFFEALYKNKKQLEPQELIDYSINHYTISKEYKKLAYTYFYKAHMLKNNLQYVDAIQCLLKSQEYSKAQKDLNLSGRIYLTLSNIASTQGEFNKAMEYTEKAILHFRKVDNKESESKAYLFLSRLYTAKEDFSKSIDFSLKAAELTTDSLLMGELLTNTGNGYFFNDQCDSALYYMYESLKYPSTKENLILRYYNLANVYSYQEKYDSAILYVNRVFELPVNIYLQEECYRILIRAAMAQDDKERLSLYLKRRAGCQDSIMILNNQSNIELIEKLYDSDKITEETKQHRLLLIILTIFLAFMTIGIFFFMYKKHRQKKQERDQYKKELEKTNKLLDNKEEELEKKQEILLLEFVEELNWVKAKYAEKRKEANFTEREQIDQTVYKEVLHIDEPDLFLQKTNNLLNNLPEKLKNDYPDINYKEIMWCCLFMLQLSTTEIALVMGYKQSSQYKFKQRLTQKLGFTNSKELETMLYDKVSL